MPSEPGVAGGRDAAPRADVARAALTRWISRLDAQGRAGSLMRFDGRDETGLTLARLPAGAVAALLQGDVVPITAIAGRLGLLGRDRLRRLEEMALASREEQGVETLHLALGMATWRPVAAGARPRAPVLLLPVEIVPGADAAGLRSRGEMRFNPVLAHVLASEHGLMLPALRLDEGPLPDILWERLRAAATQVPGFALQDGAALGHFFPHHTELMRELRRQEAALARHAVVAAVAGDPQARAGLHAAPQRAPAADGPRAAAGPASPVLPADETQRRALEAARRGRSCTIEGPPGTGKSQTIANLVAALVGDGQTVLVVAQKRTALDRLLERLRARGLDRLALDLRAAEAPGQGMAERLWDALRRLAAPLGPAMRLQEILERRRGLEAALRDLHRPHPSSRLSPLDMQGRLLRLPPEVRAAGLPAMPALAALDAAVARHVMQLFADAHDLRDLLGGQRTSPWAGARLPDQAAAADAVDLSQRALALWQAARGALQRFQAELGVEIPSLAAAERLARLQCGINASTRRYGAEIWSEASQWLLQEQEVDAPARRTASGRAAADRRLRRLRSLRQGPGPGDGLLLRDAEAIRGQAQAWREVQAGGKTPAVVPEAEAARAAIEALRPPLLKLGALLGPGAMRDLSLQALGARLADLAADASTPHSIPQALAVAGELERHGAWQALREVLAREIRPEVWPQAFESMWLRACLDSMEADLPAGAGLLGRRQDELERELTALEGLEAGATAQAVAARHAGRALQALREHPEQAALVRREATGGHRLTPGELLAAAPDVLLALFPCWLAGPYAVGPLADGEVGRFDAAVFDEASQLPVEAAVPAIWRAGQIVVAGDGLQLPPPGAAGGLAESLLEAAGFLPAFRLGWHYRSRDEALFAFANRQVYRGGVATVPGTAGHGAGIEHVLVPRGADTAADDAEVRAVVELVLREALRRPEASLGVVALAEGHARRIQDALRGAADRRRELRVLIDPGRRERFFVKPADNAQGDERDAVIVTLGVHPNGPRDAWPGPLAGEIGRRRLSVATTRARQRMIVVSSFGYQEMGADPRDPGLGLLREFLQYAAMRHGGAMAHEIGDEPVNPLEEELEAFAEDVHSALREAGLDVLPQYGALRHRLDLAVRRPGGSGAFVLAIGCDGAERHLAPSRRAWDRQRQLELMGWRWHRIWAGDWAVDREGEIRRVLGLLQESHGEPAGSGKTR